MYFDVSRIHSLININTSEKLVCAFGQHKEVNAESDWIVLIVLPHTAEAAACCYTSLIKDSCWTYVKSLACFLHYSHSLLITLVAGTCYQQQICYPLDGRLI